MEQELAKRIEQISSGLETLAGCLEQSIKERDAGILISCTEAARLLGVTPKTISMMIRDGRLNKTMIGASNGIRLSEIMETRG